jgi:leucine-rich PPR motif-containing protein
MLNLLNVEYWSNYIQPIASDIGVAIVFGFGYYLFKAFIKEESYDIKKELIQSYNKWEKVKTIQKYVAMINGNHDRNMDAYKILASMQNAGISPDIVTYNSLIDMSLRLDHLEEVKKLYEEIYDFTSPVQPDIVTYNILLKGCVQEIKENYDNQKVISEVLQRIQKYIQDLTSKSFAMNIISFNTIIDACVEAGDFDLSWKYYEELKSKGLNPDLYTYATIIKGLKSCNRSEENLSKALEILDMIKSGKYEHLKADEILYNSVLDLCLKFSKIDLMENIFNDMTAHNILPSIITYSIMIKGYGHVYNLEKALGIFELIKNMGIQVNDVVYGCLLNCLVRCCKFDLLNKYYEEMKNEGIKPNLIIYTTLIKGYNKMKRYDEAYRLFEEMIREKTVVPNIVVYNAVLDCCIESRNFEKMIEIYEEIKNGENRDEKNPPNMITYSTVIKGYCKWGKMDKAFDIYKFLISNNYKVDEVLLNTLADGFAKEKNEEKAVEIFNDAKTLGVERSHVIYSIMIKMFSNLGKINKALELYQQMKEQKIRPSLVTYTSLIQMYIRFKRINEAIQVYEEIKRSGLKLDHVIYNFIVNGCVFNKNLEKAIEILLDSINNNVKLQEETYNNTLEYLLTNKFMKNNERTTYCAVLCKALKEKNYQISLDIYSRLMKVLYKNNEKENTIRVESYKETMKSQQSQAQTVYKQKESLQKSRKHFYK